jgi:hypothetical protein
MTLTEEEVGEAASRLWQQTFGKELSAATTDEHLYARTLVKELAAQLSVDRSPEAVEVFMVWMGDGPRDKHE